MKFLETNLCTQNATTVTVSSASPFFPADNLKHPFRSKRVRTVSGVTTLTITYDFQTTEPVDAVVLLWPKEDGIKLTNTATITVKANATNIWTSPALSQVLTVDNDYSVASNYFTTDQEYRYWQIEIVDASSPWDYIELGVAWIGKSLPVENAQNGFKYSLVDQTKTATTDFGHRYSDEYPLTAQLEFSYALLDYDAIQTLENAYRSNGSRKPVLVVLDPEEAVFNKDHIMVYGNLGDSFAMTHSFYNVGSVDGITVTELS